jgi:hypothetical protein
MATCTTQGRVAAPCRPARYCGVSFTFTRHELAGAFGDLGTDLPLLVGVVLATGMDPTTVFMVFGALQIASGLVYRLPMPVQPLKAMAAIAIAGKLAPTLLAAGGLIVGTTMLVLAWTGALEWIARVVPKPVVRGVQVGLGLQLGNLALTRFLPAEGAAGWALAAMALVVILALRTNRTVPGGLVVLALGLGYAALTWPAGMPSPFGVHMPSFPTRWPTGTEFAQATLLLALPQIALSLGNSVLATRQVVADFFPEREPLTVRRIGATYGLMNLIAAPLGGLPVCHGSGGIAGHYAFGARTGASAVIYGSALVLAGLFLAGDPSAFQRLVPAPMLGALLLVEAVAVLALVRDLWPTPVAFGVALACGATAAFAPYGYAVALLGGTLLHRALRAGGWRPVWQA